ncbi:MAG: hypothetical protein C00003105_00688 [ANME-2 cluster archaeon HR1]|nr:MAG: hypothetical protein C00003105_00688 [ANME-2 cluster archaeon HR1]
MPRFILPTILILYDIINPLYIIWPLKGRRIVLTYDGINEGTISSISSYKPRTPYTILSLSGVMKTEYFFKCATIRNLPFRCFFQPLIISSSSLSKLKGFSKTNESICSVLLYNISLSSTIFLGFSSFKNGSFKSFMTEYFWFT